jgi:hypothetical protein
VRFETLGIDTMTSEYFMNRQRTSTASGILKSEAVYRFAAVLRDFGVEHLQDVSTVSKNAAFEKAIRSIPGQRSGISLQYFWMLAGSDEFIKPDRMVIRFLQSAVGREVGLDEASELLRGASDQLKSKHPALSPRLLDHAVWLYQRAVAGSV